MAAVKIRASLILLDTVTTLYLLALYCKMSTASKITLGTTISLAVGSFIFINYSQQTERDSLREGPIKDAKRLEQKRLQRFQDNAKLKRNDLEHQEQLKLKQQYEKLQPLNTEVIRGEEET